MKKNNDVANQMRERVDTTEMLLNELVPLLLDTAIPPGTNDAAEIVARAQKHAKKAHRLAKQFIGEVWEIVYIEYEIRTSAPRNAALQEHPATVH